jgi:hypothetical protein
MPGRIVAIVCLINTSRKFPLAYLLLAGLNIPSTARRLCLPRKWIFAQNFYYVVPDREFCLACLTLFPMEPACPDGLSITFQLVAHFRLWCVLIDVPAREQMGSHHSSSYWQWEFFFSILLLGFSYASPQMPLK